MKIKTNELTGGALDWAVAKCEGHHVYAPNIDWAQAGPIIEREKIDLRCMYGRDGSVVWRTVHADGPTPLIAAMRCYVASKLGDEVDVPEELV